MSTDTQDGQGEGFNVQIQEDRREYRTEIPNIVDDLGLSPIAYRLYGHYKRVGKCYQNVRTIANICKINKDSVGPAQQELIEAGLIQVFEPDNPNKSATVLVRNIWQENFEHFTKVQEAFETIENPTRKRGGAKRRVRNRGTRSRPLIWDSVSEIEGHHVSEIEGHKKEPFKKEPFKSKDLLSETDEEQGHNQKPSRKIEKLSQEEYGLMFQQIVEESKIGEVLKEFSRHLARQNSSGTMRNSRAYNDIGKPYLDLQQECSQDAIRYGLREAMRRDKDFRYAAACARNYSPPATRPAAAPTNGQEEGPKHHGKYDHLFRERRFFKGRDPEVIEEDSV